VDYLERHILETLIYLPMLAGLVLVFVPREQLMLVRWIGIGTSLLLLAGSIFVFAAFDYGEGAEVFQMVRVYPWLEQVGTGAREALSAGAAPEDVGIAFRLGVDGIAAPMVLLTGIVSLAGAVVAANIEKENKNYYILLFLLIAGVYGTFVSTDLFFFFFFYELAIVPMYLLIGVWGSSSTFKTFARPKEYGALKLVLMIVAGSVLVWVVILAVFVEAGSTTFDILALGEAARAQENGAFSNLFQGVMFVLVMIGFGLLAGLWPFHTWSPDGHVAAPTSVSMLHAGVLMKLGAFGIIRVGMMVLPQGMQDLALVLFILGTINVIYGAVSALAQNDLKYVIGYSSVSHMGYVLMGIATMEAVGVTGATLQMFSHGIMTALLFTIVGGIYERTHTRDTLVLNGLASRMGWGASAFMIAALASIGLPGLSGFMAEVMVFIGAFRTEPVLGAIGVFGALITAVYMLRLVARAFFGERDSQWDNLKDLSPREFIASAVLIVPIFFVGIYPVPFLNVIGPGVDAILTGMGR
jgi:NADH-quinone oxidoreductase subunit M